MAQIESLLREIVRDELRQAGVVAQTERTRAVSRAEAARLLNRTERHVDRMRAAGELDTIVEHGQVRVTVDSIERALSRGTQQQEGH